MNNACDNHPIMQYCRWMVGWAGCLLLLQGCGFHLRRESCSSIILAQLPEMVLENQGEYSPFIRALVKQLRDCGVRIREADGLKKDRDLPCLTVQKINFYETVVALPAHGRGVEYEYGGIFTLRFLDAAKREQVITVRVVRTGFEKTDTNPLIKAAQQDEFHRGIQEEAAAEVLKRIYWFQKLQGKLALPDEPNS